ncbi:MAG: hypothetical protein ABJH68_04845 [Ilumatobacter sp.]|uniref:hypothetical protein n=1 Tax=Ilumatobacter sp. TaxID=1967498 RepID=UPI003296C05B
MIAPELTIGLGAAMEDVVDLDGVERVARRRHPGARQDGVTTVRLEGEAVQQQLGDGLDGEGKIVVAPQRRVAVEGHGGDPEPVRVDT